MGNIIEKSIILHYIYGFITKLADSFSKSAILGFVKDIGEKIKIYFNYSKIWSFLKGPDYFEKLWLNSIVCSGLTKFLNAPSQWLRKVFVANENIFNYSYTYKFIRWFLDRFISVIGFMLIITLIIPESRWHNIYGVYIILFLSIMFFIKTIIKPSESIDVKSIDFTAVIFFTAIIMSTITSLFPKDSISYFVYYAISFIAMIIIISSIKTTKDLNRIIELIVLGVFITALYGIWQWKVIGIDVNPSMVDIRLSQGMAGRVFSTMGNPNVYGELLVLTMPFFGAVIFNAKTLKKKAFFTVLFIPVLVVLLKTGSRSAWVAFAFAVFVFVFFKNKKLLPFVILAGILAIPMLPSSIYNRILTIFNPNDTSLKYRKQILEPAMPMLRDYWISGVGLGNKVFNLIYKRYKSFTLKTVAHTHNLYLQIWLEAGFAAIVSFIWLMFRIVRKSMIAIFSKKNENISNILMAAVAGLSGLLVMGFADHIWFFNRMLLMSWIVVALVFSSFKLLNEEDYI